MGHGRHGDAVDGIEAKMLTVSCRKQTKMENQRGVVWCEDVREEGEEC